MCSSDLVLLQNADWVGPALAEAAPSIRNLGEPARDLWNKAVDIVLRDYAGAGSAYILGRFVRRVQQFLDDRGPEIRVLTEPLMANIKAIAAAVQTIDTGQVLANLLDAVPEDGAIELHVRIPEGKAGG